jgi:hypothetical protein
MRLFVFLAILTGCSHAPSHPPPIGDCPAGDSCPAPGGGGAYSLPEGGSVSGDGGGITVTPDADTDVQIPPVDSGFD